MPRMRANTGETGARKAKSRSKAKAKTKAKATPTKQKPKKKSKTRRLRKNEIELIILCSNLKDIDIDKLRVDLVRQINIGYHLRFFEDRLKLWEYITNANVDVLDSLLRVLLASLLLGSLNELLKRVECSLSDEEPSEWLHQLQATNPTMKQACTVLVVLLYFQPSSFAVRD